MRRRRPLNTTNCVNLSARLLETIPAREMDVRATMKAMSSSGVLEVANQTERETRPESRQFVLFCRTRARF